ncbi:MAG: TATA-box-binding protein [Candidatus Aenigmarchaeota archaeon]|nr:TATA-box-binding protein [Candidatus Aenigmarchaeota archaeon]MDW8149405.1 TATA-box-binding protein [Candidatus Aenigmarchaeota archaeon]
MTEEYKVSIENIVSSINFMEKIPLDELVKHSENIEYEPEQFPGAVYRIENMQVTALIFSSGKVILTGAENMEMLNQAVEKVKKLLEKTGVKTKNVEDLKIENIVASTKFFKKINLDTLAYNLETSEYEPEQFPGLVYRDKEYNLVLLVFNSGKVICTGGKNVKEVKEVINKFYKIVKKFKAFME